jgi:hypothetical protein
MRPSHTVIARKFGFGIMQVSALLNEAVAPHESAGYLAQSLNVPAQIEGYEKDAIVALAGFAANRREHPHLPILDLITDDSADMHNVRSAIYRIICLKLGRPVPQDSVAVKADAAMRAMMLEEYSRLLRETTALVDQHWPAIKRVARALENHNRIDQAEVDRLIALTERLARATH